MTKEADHLIFVFGSNLAGRHGAGAANYAVEHYGALYGIGEGLTGRSYAIPTKDFNIETREIHRIETSIAMFLKCTIENPHLIFKVTPIGCGLAGYTRKEIASIFKSYTIPFNVVFSREWFQ